MSSLAEKHHEKIDDDDATSARAVKAAKLATVSPDNRMFFMVSFRREWVDARSGSDICTRRARLLLYKLSHACKSETKRRYGRQFPHFTSRKRPDPAVDAKVLRRRNDRGARQRSSVGGQERQQLAVHDGPRRHRSRVLDL